MTEPVDGSLSLVGAVTFRLRSGTPQAITTRIDFPDDYPRHEPRAVQSPQRFARDANHHFYPDGEACLWLDVETRWRPSDPDGLRMFLDQLTVFYYRQLMMEADPTIPFPGPARAHGVAGYLEYLEERFRLGRRELPRMIGALTGGVSRNAPCPCGGGVRYRKCHRDAVRRFRERAAPRYQQDVLEALREMSPGRAAARLGGPKPAAPQNHLA